MDIATKCQTHKAQRLIDVNALPRHGQRGGIVHWKDIDNAPTIDACPYYHHEPTGEPFCEMEDRRHGKWTLKMNERFYWKECSMCGHKPPRSDEYGTYIESDYCPNCGAEMDGERSEE